MTAPKPASPATVLYLHSSDDLYGADMILLNIVTGLDRTRFHPVVVLPDDMRHVGLLSRELAAAGIEFHHLPIAILRRRYLSPRGLPGFLGRIVSGTMAIRRLARGRNVQLIHGFTLAVIAAPAAALALRRPLLMHAHEIILRPRLLRQGLHFLAAKSARRLLCVSDAVRNNILEDQPGEAARVVVLRNGIPGAEPARESRGELRRELGLPEGLPLVGMIGRISPWKGQEIFVRAANLLHERGVPAHFVAMGGVFDGERRHLDRLHQVIAGTSLGPALTLVDFRKDARRFLPAFDLFVLPSTLPDPLPTVVLEAMAAGVPVIAAAHGGSLEMVVDGETGRLVAPGDPQALAQAMEALLSDPAQAARMGRAGLERFQRVFALGPYLEAIEGTYDQVCRESRKSNFAP
jgi:glycosyltransferase involved in cell wall biosynthesis